MVAALRYSVQVITEFHQIVAAALGQCFADLRSGNTDIVILLQLIVV